MTGRISPLTLICFLLAGLLGVVAFSYYYSEAFPEASLDMTQSRGEITEKSRGFLAGRGFDLSGYRNVATFGEQRKEIDFLERHLGLKRANGLFRSTVPVWRWSVRWFKELEEVEYTVEYTPDGRLAEFTRRIPKASPGKRLDEREARRIGEAFLGKVAGFDMARYAYIERTMEDCPHRLDQIIIFRSRDWSGVGGSEYRLAVKIQGDEVGGFTQWLKIPQAWTLSQEEKGAKRDLLAGLSYLPIMILYLAMAVIFFWRAHAGDIRWRWSFVLASLSAAIVFLEYANRLPLNLVTYDTTQSLNVFWMKNMARPLLATALSFILFVPLFSATDSMGRLCLPGRPWASGIFSRDYLFSGDAVRQVAAGYGLAFAAVGYVTLFYVVGNRTMGVWSPVEVNFSNSFTTYFPSITAIYTGFSAAFTEELTFRLFAIGLLYRITKRFWPAVIIPAFIWGFAHTTYPQEPIWIRGAELTVEGIVYGWVFLRFGLIVTLVSHFVYNVFVGTVPLLQSGQVDLVAHGVVALTLPLLAFLFIRTVLPRIPWKRVRGFFSRKGGSDSSPEASRTEAAYSSGAGPMPWKRFALFVAVAGLAYGLSFLIPEWDFYGKAPPVKLTKAEGAAEGEKIRKEYGFDTTGYTSFTVFRDHTSAPPLYLVDLLGPAGAQSRYGRYYRYEPEWTTRWYREKTVQTLKVSVDEKGRLLSLLYRPAETDPGARLNEKQAREVAAPFLAAARSGYGEKWEWIETEKKDRPHRLDYRFTYRDRNFEAGDLVRKISVIVSGDRVTALGTPWYDVPEDWKRKREIEARSLRNSVRQLVFVVLAAAVGIFFVVQAVILFRRRTAGRKDVRASILWALAIGAIPAVLEIVNSLPRFYYDYFTETAEPLWTYTLTGILALVAEVVWMPAGVFCLVLLARMALRAWLPGKGEFSALADTFRPGRLGSKENFQGLFLGIGAALFSSALGKATGELKMWLAPDLFAPSAETTGIAVNQFSEMMSLAGKVPEAAVACLCLLLVAATFRRFLRNEWFMLAAMAGVVFLIADRTSISWPSLLTDWSVETASLLIIYLMFTRVVRWNIMGYAVWMWIEVNLDAIPNFVRFAFSRSPEFSWPAIQQMAVLTVPLAFLLGWTIKKAFPRRAVPGDNP